MVIRKAISDDIVFITGCHDGWLPLGKSFFQEIVSTSPTNPMPPFKNINFKAVLSLPNSIDFLAGYSHTLMYRLCWLLISSGLFLA